MLEQTIKSEFHNLKDAFEHEDRNIYDAKIKDVRVLLRAYELCYGKNSIYRELAFNIENLNLLYIAKYNGDE
jgi:hypothetical protein